MFQTGTFEDIRDYFTKPFPSLNSDVTEAMQLISKLKKEFEEHGEHFDFRMLLKHRILASNSLRRGEGLVEWENASKYVAQQVLDDQLLTSEHLRKINSLLAGEERGWRTTRIYTADEEYLPPEYLNEFRDYFDANIPRHHDFPLQQAFLAYCWAVTMHGFLNQNGRTARLAGDWILLQNGYVPIYFATSVSAHVAQSINGHKRDLLVSFINYLRALADSYELMRIK